MATGPDAPSYRARAAALGEIVRGEDGLARTVETLRELGLA